MRSKRGGCVHEAREGLTKLCTEQFARQATWRLPSLLHSLHDELQGIECIALPVSSCRTDLVPRLTR